MKKSVILIAFAALAAILLCASGIGRRSLIDGKNIATHGGAISINNKVFTVGDGTLVVFNKGNYSDFELKLTARTKGDGRGFIVFHTDDDGKGGYQIPLDNSLNSLQWRQKKGSLFAAGRATVATNRWFDMTIRARGETVTIEVNNRITEYQKASLPYHNPENAQQFRSNGKFALKNSSGGNIEIREMNVRARN